MYVAIRVHYLNESIQIIMSDKCIKIVPDKWMYYRYVVHFFFIHIMYCYYWIRKSNKDRNRDFNLRCNYYIAHSIGEAEIIVMIVNSVQCWDNSNNQSRMFPMLFDDIEWQITKYFWNFFLVWKQVCFSLFSNFVRVAFSDVSIEVSQKWFSVVSRYNNTRVWL